MAEKVNAQVVVIDSFAAGYSLEEEQAIQRAADYWNQILVPIAFFVPRPVSVEVKAKKNMGEGSAESTPWIRPFDDTVTFDSSTKWETKRITQLTGRGGGNIESVAIHEFAHLLGINTIASPTWLGSGEISWFDIPFVPDWDYDQHVYYKETDVDVSMFFPDSYPFPGTVGDYTFRHTATNRVLSDNGLSSGKFLQIENGQTTGAGGFVEGSSICHPYTPYGRMNASNAGADIRPFFNEAELAMLIDIGYFIILDRHFGRSFYQTHSGGAITNNIGFDSGAMYGIGLHLVAGGNTIIQNADLHADGFAGAGIRIENNNNNVTISKGVTVSANGDNGIGVLSIWGTGTVLVNKGTIEAKGKNGYGVWFQEAITGDNFTNSGLINAGSNDNYAVWSEDTITASKVNFVSGTRVIGKVGGAKGTKLSLTFGKSVNADGNAIASGDSSFFLVHSDDIVGDGDIDLETWGGQTTLSAATLKFYSGIVGASTIASTLNLPGTVDFDTLGLGSATNTTSVLDGKTTGRITVDNGVTNRITVQNLASLEVPFIDNVNTIKDNTLVKTDSSFDVSGWAVGIRNRDDGKIVNNTTIESTWGLLNLGLIDNNGTIRCDDGIENQAGATISRTNTLLKGWSLDNGGLITETTKMEVDDDLTNTNTGLIRDTSKMDVSGNIDNAGRIEETGLASITGDVLNKAGGIIFDTNKMTIGGQLVNAGLVDTVNLVDVTGNIDNSNVIRNVTLLQTAANLRNNVAGQLFANTTIKATGKLDNSGLVDTANLVEAGGDIENAGVIQNIVTLHSKTDIINRVGAQIVDNQTVRADQDVLNRGTIDRFTTLQAGRDVQNNAAGYINVEQASTMSAGRNVANAGLVKANGTVNVANQFMNTGWLVGAGFVNTTTGLVNNGTISVGNIPGEGAGKMIDTLKVTGPYVNNATGRILVDVDPSHYPSKPFAGLHNDLIDVTGIGTVDGGEVFVTAPSNDKNINPPPAGPARYVGNTHYTFLNTSALDVKTKMTAIDPVNLLLFDFLADHDTKSYWLDVQREYYYGPFGDTFNQIAVGNYIDEIGLDPDPMGDFFDVLVKLDKLNVGIAHRAGISRAAKFAVDQMSGAIYGTIGTASVTNTTIVNNTLSDVLRRDAFGGGKIGCDPCEATSGCRAATKRNAWGLAYGMGGHTQFDGNAYGYDQTFGGTLIGIDRQFQRQMRWGAFVSYGEGRISSNLIEKSKSNEFLGGLYFRKDMQNGYILASGGLGSNHYDTERTISFMNRKATNKHDALVGTVSLERGLEFESRLGKFMPFFGLQYVANQQDGFTEKGADSLNLVGDIATAHSFRSMLGTRVSLKPVTVRKGNLSLYGNAAWMHEFLSRTHTNFTAQFSNPGLSNFSSTAKYTVKGNDPNRDWGIVGVGLNFERNNFRLFGGYDAYVNAQQILHTGNTGLAYGW